MLPEEVSARILWRVETSRRSLRDSAMDFFDKYREYSFMKPIVRVLTLNTLRHYIFLDYLLSELGIGINKYKGCKKWLLRVLAYSLTFGRDYAKKSRVIKIIDKYNLPNNLLDLEKIDHIEIRKNLVKINRLDIAYSFPKWLLNYVMKARIPMLERFLETLLNDPVTWIRVSLHRIRRRDLVKLLNSEGFSVKEDSDLNDCIQVVSGNRGLLAKTRLHELGYFVIQDKASILVSHVLVNSIDNKKILVLDVTSGAGLKSSHIIQLGIERVIAQDISYDVLVNNKILVKRLGFNQKVLLLATDSTYGLPLSAIDNVGAVLIDPPCSGIGRFSLQPELKLHLNKNKIRELIRLQYRLLKTVVSSVKRGVKILYSTCTVTVNENEDLVKLFEREGYVELIKQKPFIGSRSFIDSRIQRLYPHIHRTQGFTIALMETV